MSRIEDTHATATGPVLAQVRIEKIAEAVTEHVEGEDGEGDGHPGKDGHPRGLAHEALRFLQHLSPRGDGRSGAETEVGQPRLGENGASDSEAGLAR